MSSTMKKRKVLWGPLEGPKRPGSAAGLFGDGRGQRAKRGDSYLLAKQLAWERS